MASLAFSLDLCIYAGVVFLPREKLEQVGRVSSLAPDPRRRTAGFCWTSGWPRCCRWALDRPIGADRRRGFLFHLAAVCEGNLRAIGVLFRLVWLKVDGFHWFRWGLFHLPGPSIFPKGHLCLGHAGNYGYLPGRAFSGNRTGGRKGTCPFAGEKVASRQWQDKHHSSTN